MNMKLFIDDAGALLQPPKAGTNAEAPSDLAVLASLIVPDSGVSLLDDGFAETKTRFGIDPAQEVKSSDYSPVVRRPPSWTSRRPYLSHLSVKDGEDLFAGLCATVAKCRPARIACAAIRRSVAYDPWWITARTRAEEAIHKGVVRPERVFTACYQDLLQRAAKDLEDLRGDTVSVYVDYTNVLDRALTSASGDAKQGWREIHRVHRLLTRQRPVYSWGQPLDDVADAAHFVHSDAYVGLQAADLVAGAFFSWLRGHYEPAYSHLVPLIRQPRGELYRYGFVCVPKKRSWLSESLCREIARRAREARSGSSHESRPPATDEY